MLCEKCGFRNLRQQNFCGNCGTKLRPASSQPNAEFAVPRPERPRGPWSRPSLLGLGEDPIESPGSILDQRDEGPTTRWMNLATITIALLGCCAAGWHWRNELRGFMVAGLAHASDDRNHPPAASAADSAVAQPDSAQATSASDAQPKVDASGQSTSEVVQSQSVVEPASLKEQAKPTSIDEGDRLEADGEKYLYGTGVPSNCDRAHQELIAADELGNARADSVLGTMYATGHCVDRDLSQAYRWFSKAEQHDPADPRLKQNLDMVWNGMSADERLAVRANLR